MSAPVDQGLTDRQRAILVRLAAGKTTRQIGRELRLAERTVKNHVQTLVTAIGADNRTHAVAIGLRKGLIT